MGLRFGELSANEILSDEVDGKLSTDDFDDIECEAESPDAFLDDLDTFALDYPEATEDRMNRQILWTDANRKDLTRLGKMLSTFLAVPQFAADSGLFASHVVDPLMHKSGPLPGSIRVLRQVMESVMVRHRYGGILNLVIYVEKGTDDAPGLRTLKVTSSYLHCIKKPFFLIWILME
jgi:hypothetical protein